MSEDILKSLMQLFAIIAKQAKNSKNIEREYVKIFLRQKLDKKSVDNYLSIFDDFFKEHLLIKTVQSDRTSVKDSVKTLGICNKINKSLTQKQKIIVLVRLFELINYDKNFDHKRMALIDTIATIFSISKLEYSSVKKFVLYEDLPQSSDDNILIISDQKRNKDTVFKHITVCQLNGHITILKINSVGLYFIKYNGKDDLTMNGLKFDNQQIHPLSNGSVLKLPLEKTIFYTDIVEMFMTNNSIPRIFLEVKDVSFRFPNGNVGLHEINLYETSGKLIGIMGASGTGKTTLLNILTGINIPSKGEVLINGINISTESEKLKGIIGYIPQDDLLIEELTVYQNLYYNAKLVLREISEQEIHQRVLKVLSDLGLINIKNLKVGSVFNKKISGGQRKRLNIGLELIREPDVLFIDEPTSGLSSRDSEVLMEIIREQSLKGKLIFVNIHQPSSTIYKLFDEIIILDSGGYQIYYGNPIEAVTYFKKLNNHINKNIVECPECGNVNSEIIFNIIEERVVDEYGNLTDKRKVTPQEWYKHNIDKQKKTLYKEPNYEVFPKQLRVVSWIKQFKVFFVRDMLSKLANIQYLIINFFEAPLLALILTFILRYVNNSELYIYIYIQGKRKYCTLYIHVYNYSNVYRFNGKCRRNFQR